LGSRHASTRLHATSAFLPPVISTRCTVHRVLRRWVIRTPKLDILTISALMLGASGVAAADKAFTYGREPMTEQERLQSALMGLSVSPHF
jgi:hypothetical protein